MYGFILHSVVIETRVLFFLFEELPEAERTMVVIPSLNMADLRSVLTLVGCDLPPLPQGYARDDRSLSYFDIQDGTTLFLRYTSVYHHTLPTCFVLICALLCLALFVFSFDFCFVFVAIVLTLFAC